MGARGYTLRLLQTGSGRTASVSISQEALGMPTILELKGDTRETLLRQVLPGVRVDWGDGTTTTTDESVSSTKNVVRHTYSGSVPTPRVVKIYGMRERKRIFLETPFDDKNLIGVRQLSDMNDLAGLFSFCKELKSVPANLFEQNRGAKSLECCFNGCSALTSVPASLFSGMSQVDDLSACFQDCKSLRTLPSGLFDDCRAESFNNCFQACTSLQSLPKDLFSRQTSAKTFIGTFIGCTGLTTLPGGLFDACSMVTSFSGCFDDCTRLTAIPAGLFDKQHNATDFTRCFLNCTALRGETPYATVNGTKVKLWQRDPATNGYAKVEKYEEGFRYCKGLSDYSQIPTGWASQYD